MRWYHTTTGGGCTADRTDLQDGRYALVTDSDNDDGRGAPGAETTWFVVGLYSASDAQIDYTECATLAECEAWIREKK